MHHRDHYRSIAPSPSHLSQHRAIVIAPYRHRSIEPDLNSAIVQKWTTWPYPSSILLSSINRGRVIKWVPRDLCVHNAHLCYQAYSHTLLSDVPIWKWPSWFIVYTHVLHTRAYSIQIINFHENRAIQSSTQFNDLEARC